jgi:hypothetical protein
LALAAAFPIAKLDEVDISSWTMASHFEEIDDSGESRATGQLTRHVRKFDRLDGGDLHLARADSVAPSDLDVTA